MYYLSENSTSVYFISENSMYHIPENSEHGHHWLKLLTA